MLLTLSQRLPLETFIDLNDLMEGLEVSEPEDMAVVCMHAYCQCAKSVLEQHAIKLFKGVHSNPKVRGRGVEIILGTEKFDHEEDERYSLPIAFQVPFSLLRYGFELLGCDDEYSLLRNAINLYKQYLDFRRRDFWVPMTIALKSPYAGREALMLELFKTDVEF